MIIYLASMKTSRVVYDSETAAATNCAQAEGECHGKNLFNNDSKQLINTSQFSTSLETVGISWDVSWLIHNEQSKCAI